MSNPVIGFNSVSLFDILMIVITIMSAFGFAHLLNRKLLLSTPSKESNRYGCIDGIRGYLAIFVFIHHFVITWFWKNDGNWSAPPIHYFDVFGSFGVSLFFMITGYLFVSKLKKFETGRIDWIALYKSRFYRITPLYLFSIIIISSVVFSSAYSIGLNSFSSIFYDYMKWFLYVGASINGFEDTKRVIAGVDWSLRYEWLFYISLPLIFIAIRKGWTYLLAIQVISLVLFIYPLDAKVFFSQYFILFTVGGSITYINTRFIKNFIDSFWGSVIVLLMISATLFYAEPYSGLQLVLLTIIFFAISSGNSLFGLLRKEASIFLGEISYSIYLMHGIFLYFAFTTFPIISVKNTLIGEFLLYMPASVCAVVLISLFTYYFIERPFMRLGAKK